MVLFFPFHFLSLSMRAHRTQGWYVCTRMSGPSALVICGDNCHKMLLLHYSSRDSSSSSAQWRPALIMAQAFHCLVIELLTVVTLTVFYYSGSIIRHEKEIQSTLCCSPMRLLLYVRLESVSRSIGQSSVETTWWNEMGPPLLRSLAFFMRKGGLFLSLIHI